MIRKIGFQQAKELLDSEPGAVLLDVREEPEYITGHAVDAILLPVDELTDERALDVIPSLDTPVLVYCRSGYRSNVVAYLFLVVGSFLDIEDIRELDKLREREVVLESELGGNASQRVYISLSRALVEGNLCISALDIVYSDIHLDLAAGDALL